eukprot:6774133-Heterocapsa_arctica.AAC.1
MGGHWLKLMIAEAPKGLVLKGDPAGRPAPTTPQGTAGGGQGSQLIGPRKEVAAGGPPTPKAAGLNLGPVLAAMKNSGRKRAAEDDTKTLKFRSEVEAQGSAMEDTGGSAAAVPGQMLQDPAPMDQDPKDGGELSEEEQETWNR